MNDSDVVVSRGIPFATAARFGAPERIAYEGPHQHRSPVTAPQLPGRLEPVMGAPVRLPQSEDCLELTVTAPAAAEPGGRPVMVWIHGGAYLAGGGGWNLYDATELVRETGIVVVSINYRSGCSAICGCPASRRAISDCSIKSPHWSGCASTSPASVAIQIR